RRVLPPLPVLNNEADLNTWDYNLSRIAMRFELSRYIDKSFPQPTEGTEEYKTWKQDWGDLIDLMMASLKRNEIRQRVINLGWTATSMDPYVLKEKIFQALQQGTVDTTGTLIDQYFTLRREKFSTFADYFTKLGILKQRMTTNNLVVSEEVHLWAALNGIKKIYPELYQRLVCRMEDKSLTWHILVAEFNKK
ncbi:hypothetical protein QBC43DRAFT_172492, partial [Cladorrhinum sp. PSN259]